MVNKAHKGSDVGLLLVGALLGSFRLPVSKEDNRGTKVEWIVQLAESAEFIGALSREVNRWHAEHGADRQYKNPFYVRADVFSLVYGEFSDEKPFYDLTLQTTVSRKADSAGWFTAPVSVTCTDRYTEP